MEEDKILDIISNHSTSLEELPSEVILKIFSFVEKKQYFHLALVCKHWLWLISDPHLWKNVHFKEADLTVERFEYLVRNRFLGLVCNMNLSGCVLNPQTLAHVATKCPQIKNLSLKSCRFNVSCEYDTHAQSTNNSIAFSNDMIRLDIRNFGKGFILLHAILMNSQCEKLECFGFGHSKNAFECSQFNGFNNFISRLKNLRVLEFTNVNFINDEVIEIIANSMPNLEYVGLSNCKLVKGTTLGLLLRKCPNVSSLILSDTCIDDSALFSIDWSNSKVDEIDLSGCDLVSNIGLAYVLGCLKNIQYLRLDRCGIGRAFGDSVIDSCINDEFLINVKLLSFNFSSQIINGFTRICEPLNDGSYRFLHLHHLSLRACSNLNVNNITSSMLLSMPALKICELGNVFLSPEPFAGIKKHLFSTRNNLPAFPSTNSATDCSLVLYNDLIGLDMMREGGVIQLFYLLARNNLLLERLSIANRYYTEVSATLDPQLAINRGEHGSVYRSIKTLLQCCQCLSRVELPYIDKNTKNIINYALNQTANDGNTDRNIVVYNIDPNHPSTSKPRRSLDAEFNQLPLIHSKVYEFYHL
ncbi:hypothetical protein HZS_363, partial [Henneguya salminicola]